MLETERKTIHSFFFWYIEIEVLVSYLNEDVQERFRNTKRRAKTPSLFCEDGFLKEFTGKCYICHRI